MATKGTKGSKGKKSTQRKLTAILSADVAGYSRLMGADEEATLETLTAYRKVFTSSIPKFRGRVVDAKGDALLAEFAAVTDAVGCAVEIQRELAERNTELSDDRRMDFRIGINLGEVMVKGEEIYGDGVNVAARLEALAEPGGICISRPVYDQVESKLHLECEYLGEQQVKNIAKPVRAYKVLLEPGQAPTRLRQAIRTLARRRRKITLGVVAAVVVALVAVLGWNYYQLRSSAAALAAFEKEAAFPLPDKPSIAVLAFENLSGDPKQEYFSDGLTENIITKLAVFPNMFVVARQSSFRYKGKPVDIRQVGRELGVRYVLEGSVQRDAKRVRVTAQLIDAATGSHIFAKRYDRVQKDLFAVQDEIANQVLGDLHLEIGRGGEALAALRSTDNFEALDAYLRGVESIRRFRKESALQAEEHFKKALDLDPKFAKAMAFMGRVHMLYALRAWLPDPEKHWELAAQWAERAIATNPNDSTGYGVMARIYARKGNHEKAIALAKRAVELQPNDARNLAVLAFTYSLAREHENRLEAINKALRLAPYPPAWFHVVAGYANAGNDRYEEAIREYKKALARFKGGRLQALASAGLIVSYMKMEREEEARAEVKKFQQSQPGYSIGTYVQQLKRNPYKDYSWIEEYAVLLRKAGLPD